MLDFRIDTFLSVCKNMSYTKTAKELNITQPGVSQHIKYLENYYGAELFQYRNRRLFLTSEGEVLRDAMLTIKHDSVHIQNRFLENQEHNKIIKFGATLTVGEFYLPKRLSAYLKKKPQIRIEFIIGNTTELMELLENGDIEFAIVEGYFYKNQYDAITVSDEPYILVASSEYPIDEIDHIGQLLSERLIVREEGSGTKEVFERFLSEKGYTIGDFQNVSTVSSIHVVKQLVKNGCGITFIYKVAVQDEIDQGILKEIKIPNTRIHHEFQFIWRKNSAFKDYYIQLYHELTRDSYYEI